jgi:D-glycero-alpha-D-manno-heptose 1-phosphate guanylyltransferase
LALIQALEPSVFVVNCDTYLGAELSVLARFHRIFAARALTMAVVRVDKPARYGDVLIEDHVITGFSEKGRTGPGWIYGGLYVIEKDFPWHPDLPARFSFESGVLVPFLSEIRPAAFSATGIFLIWASRRASTEHKWNLAVRARAFAARRGDAIGQFQPTLVG